MPHTLRAAAKAAGRDRTTIMRAIRAGKLSATRDEATGAWLIEPAELHRLYPPDEAAQAGGGSDAQLRTLDSRDIELAELRVRVAVLQEGTHLRDDTIADLRRRLDGEAEERRRLTALLDDRRAKRRGWWWSR